MRPHLMSLMALCCWLGSPAGLRSEEAPPPAEAAAAADVAAPAEEAAPEPVPFDRIELLDGSVILGEIVELGGGMLVVKVAFGDGETITLKWSHVAKVYSAREHTYVLTDGQRLTGTSKAPEEGKIAIQPNLVAGESSVNIDSVAAINPTPPRGIRMVGNINLGVSIADGNTQTKTASFSAEAVVSADKMRLTMRAAWNYASNSESGMTARNTRGGIKFDYFMTERAFLFISAMFEEDKFQDLSLRTAIAAGPGYQFIKAGDFEEEWLKGLEFYGEVGLAFFDEDYRRADDNRYISARWAAKLDWPIHPTVILFHSHEGYPGLENGRDLYISTEQGVRFKFLQNFTASLQVNWRWDNTPAPGFERSDTLYLVTLGYIFDV